MKIDAKKFSDALASVGRVVGGRLSLPILTSVRLEAKSGMLSLRTTNCESEAIELVPCDGDLEAVCAPISKLLAFFKPATGEAMISLITGRLVCSVEGQHCDIGTVVADGFPPSFATDEKAIGLNSEDLANLIKRVSWSCDESNTERPFLQSVHVLGCEQSITCEAFDGKTFAYNNIPAISAKFEALIPSRSAHLVVEALCRKGATLIIGEKSATVRHDSGELTTRLGEGMFPNTEKVVASPRSFFGEVDRQSLLDVASLCLSCVSDFALSNITLSFEEKSLTALCNSGEFKYSRKFDGKFSPAEHTIDAKRLKNALSALQGETVKISHNGQHSLVFESGSQLIFVATVNTKAIKQAA